MRDARRLTISGSRDRISTSGRKYGRFFSEAVARRRSAVTQNNARTVVVSPSAENVGDETTRERPAALGKASQLRETFPFDPSMPYCVLFLARYVIFCRSASARDRRSAYRSAKRSRSCAPWRLSREKRAFRFSCQRRAAILRQLSRSMTTRGEWRVCSAGSAGDDASRSVVTFFTKAHLLNDEYNEYEIARVAWSRTCILSHSFLV